MFAKDEPVISSSSNNCSAFLSRLKLLLRPWLLHRSANAGKWQHVSQESEAQLHNLWAVLNTSMGPKACFLPSKYFVVNLTTMLEYSLNKNVGFKTRLHKVKQQLCSSLQWHTNARNEIFWSAVARKCLNCFKRPQQPNNIQGVNDAAATEIIILTDHISWFTELWACSALTTAMTGFVMNSTISSAALRQIYFSCHCTAGILHFRTALIFWRAWWGCRFPPPPGQDAWPGWQRANKHLMQLTCCYICFFGVCTADPASMHCQGYLATSSAIWNHAQHTLHECNSVHNNINRPLLIFTPCCKNEISHLGIRSFWLS